MVRIARRWPLVAMGVLALGCSACAGSEADSSVIEDTGAEVGVETWGTSDMQFRRDAWKSPAPDYPAASLSSGIAGVVVATVVASTEGNVIQVEILEAPDIRTGDAVAGALAKWKVQTPVHENGQRVRLRAKLYFYFIIEDDKGFVLSPEKMLKTLTARPRRSFRSAAG